MEKNMEFNFEILEERVLETLKLSDLRDINKILMSLKEPTICTGVGGSKIVSEYVSKVLSAKNNIITINIEPRDFLYQNISCFSNVISCSYSGKNHGVSVSFDNNLNKYLLSNNESFRKDVKSLRYRTELPSERSFISLAATLMPMAIVLNYYLENDIQDIHSLFSAWNYNDTIDNSEVYEIMTGKDTSAASMFLESTFVESGIALPIVHDKYSYCHGRSTLSYKNDNSLIYFNRNTDLDKLLLEEAKKYYKKIITLDTNFIDPIIDDFNLTLKSMYLAKAIAEKKKLDLSDVDHSPLTRKVYKYNGGM